MEMSQVFVIEKLFAVPAFHKVVRVNCFKPVTSLTCREREFINRPTKLAYINTLCQCHSGVELRHVFYLTVGLVKSHVY